MSGVDEFFECRGRAVDKFIRDLSDCMAIPLQTEKDADRIINCALKARKEMKSAGACCGEDMVNGWNAKALKKE